ncbi:MAG: helix-turn-helix transcriptional regulator [Bacilli bacterium]|nr:helix-turn-helix transcriptional regulator [Bacilli bacterium]
MSFGNKLNNYIDMIGCSAKELSEASGISTSVISRYRSGERIPKYNSKQFNQLIDGLSLLCKDFDIKEIKTDLEYSLGKSNINFDIFKDNLNIIINTLNVNVSDLARYLGFDSSYLSKIRKGIRIPQHLDEFVNAVIKYIVDNYKDNKSIELVSSLVDSEINSNDEYIFNLDTWFKNKAVNYDNGIQSFLVKLDEFELNEYIKSIKFDKLKVPTVPIQIPKSKTYYGIEGFKDSQIDALKSIVLSKSTDDVFFYSNMSIIEGSKDKEFTKKFMIGLALMLKKGLHLNIIHDLDRPWKELMLGLEGWIPLYMTGQINPYYFKDNSNLLYSQIECVGGTTALSGSSMSNNIKQSKYYVTNKKEEVNYYRENAKLLLKRANILMDIYTSSRKEIFLKLLNDNILDDRRNIFYNLPIYTISNKLLNRILNRNNISEEDKKIIINYIESEKKRIKKTLNKNKIVDEINIISKDDFYNVSLSLSNIFYDKKILYNYDEYLEHIELIKEYSIQYKNYHYKIRNTNIFKNINIHIIKNKQVIISKENNPSIHFVIYHPKLINAIERFIL